MGFRYPKGVRFECQRCARCCGDVLRKKRKILLLEAEVKQIARVTELRQEGFAIPLSGNSPYRYAMKKKGGKCVFLERSACKIYPIRPLICRTYPFSLERASSGHVFKASDDCPGIGLGDVVREEEFRRMFGEVRAALG